MSRNTGNRQGAKKKTRYDFIAATNGPAVVARLRAENNPDWQGDAAALFRQFADRTDPTGGDGNNPWRYLVWICSAYAKSFKGGSRGILAEDLYKIKADLALFEDKKKRRLLTGGRANIRQYTVKDLAAFAAEVQGGALDGFEDMLAGAPAEVMNETTIIYRGPEGVALIPHSRGAAIHWSRGTRWCTGAENGDNAFFEYNAEGPLVILFTATKERYQGHPDSTLMDEQDSEAEMTPALTALLDRIDDRFIRKEGRQEEPYDCWNNRDYVLTQVLRDGSSLGYAANRLQADREIVLAAVRQYGAALKWAAQKFRADREIVLEAVRKDGAMLRCAAEELRADREIVFEAVRQDGSALGYAAEELRADREIVFEAVRKDGAILRYAAEELRADRKIVLEALLRHDIAFVYAAAALQEDPSFIAEALRIAPRLIHRTPHKTWVKLDPAVRQGYFADRLKTDWKHLACAAECGVTPSLEMQRKAFARAREEDPDLLEKSLHIFPALREEWKKRALSLAEAAAILNPTPAAAGNVKQRNRFFHI